MAAHSLKIGLGRLARGGWIIRTKGMGRISTVGFSVGSTVDVRHKAGRVWVTRVE